MSSGTFIVKNKDHLIPKTLLEKLVALYPSAWGSAAVATDGTIQCDGLLGAPTVETLDEIQNGLKPFKVLFCLHNFNQASSIDDVQPFVMLTDDKDNPCLLFAMDGDFSGYALTDDPHDPAVYAAQNLRTLLEPIQRIAKGDMKEVGDYIDNPGFVDSLFKHNVAKEGAAFCFVLPNGDFVTKQNSEHFGQFDWGQVSNKHGYFEGEAKAADTAEAPKEERRLTMMERMTGKIKPASEPIARAEQVIDKGPVIQNKVAPAKVQELREKALATAGTPILWAKPPAHYTVKKDAGLIKSFYRNYSLDGQCPEDWAKLPPIQVHKNKIKSFSEMKERMSFQVVPAPTVTAAPTEATATKGAPGKVTAKASPVASTEPIPQHTPTEVKPGITDDKVADFKKDVLAKLKESTQIADPKKLMEEEKKIKTFQELTGQDPLDFIPRWYAVQIVDRHPDLAKQLIMDLNRSGRSWRELADAASDPAHREPPLKETVTPEEKPIEQPKTQVAAKATGGGMRKGALASLRRTG